MNLKVFFNQLCFIQTGAFLNKKFCTRDKSKTSFRAPNDRLGIYRSYRGVEVCVQLWDTVDSGQWWVPVCHTDIEQAGWSCFSCGGPGSVGLRSQSHHGCTWSPLISCLSTDASFLSSPGQRVLSLLPDAALQHGLHQPPQHLPLDGDQRQSIALRLRHI